MTLNSWAQASQLQFTPPSKILTYTCHCCWHLGLSWVFLAIRFLHYSISIDPCLHFFLKVQNLGEEGGFEDRKTSYCQGWKGRSAVMSACCLSRRPRFDVEHPDGAAPKTPVTPVPRNLTPSSCYGHLCGVQTYMKAEHPFTYKNSSSVCLRRSL